MQEHKKGRAWVGAALLLSLWSVACERPAPPPPAELADVGGAEDASPDAVEDAPSSCGAPGPGCPRLGERCLDGGGCSDELRCGLDGVCGGLGASCDGLRGCEEGALCSLSQCDGYTRRCIQPDRCLGPSRCEEGQCDKRQLSVGKATTCLLEPDGALGCWGSNFNDEVNVPVGLYRAVSLGSFFSCAITDAGLLDCWGDNAYGQTSSPNEAEALEVDSGLSSACARLTDATVVCWGDPADGLLDAPSGTFEQLSTGGYHACALKRDGVAVCWGDPDDFEGLPQQPLLAISVGWIHGCGLTAADREVVCWGFQDARVTDRPTEAGILKIAAGPEISCAIRADASLVCWGDATGFFEDFTPPQGTFSQVAVGDSHACALEVEGRLVCWGKVKLP